MSNAGYTIQSRTIASRQANYRRSRSASTSASASRAAFTLIELLVVIAITAVLLTLLFQPLISGFQFTSEAQATTEAQDAARVTMEQVTREIGSAAAVRDTSGKYLDMRVFTPTGNDEVIAHAYNAYIDIVPARTGTQTGTGAAATVADPTVNPYASTGQGEGYYVDPVGAAKGEPALVGSPITLPISPATTFVRYFVGLATPFNLTYAGTGTAEEEPYINMPESQVPSATDSIAGGNDWTKAYAITNHLNNPYILYRAEVSPYKPVKGTDGTITYQVNSQLFDTDPTTKLPVLDDPDFFRIVNTGNADADAAHNLRVYHWFQAAKPVISSSDANLISQAHNGNGVVQYGSVATNVGTVQLSAGTTTESATQFPIVRTLVSFSPATVSDQPMNPTSTSDVAQGFGSAPTDALVPYIPTQYASQSSQWAGNKNLLITENSLLATQATGTAPNTFTTYVYQVPPGSTPATGYASGDLIETNTAAKKDVFDVSRGTVLDSADEYIVFSVGSAGGSVNFSTPDLPATSSQDGTPLVPYTAKTSIAGAVCGDADTSNPNNPFWYVTFDNTYAGANASTNTSSSYGSTDADNVLQIHLKPQPQLPGYDETKDAVLLPHPGLSDTNYLPNIATASFGAAGTVTAGSTPASSNGRVVANSERVYGPDENPGAASVAITATTAPANYPVVLYSRLPFNLGQVDTIGANQYMIDYDHGIIYLGEPKSAGGPIDTSDYLANPQKSTVLVAFNYQNNAYIPLNGSNTNGTTSEINPALLASAAISPDTVRATYQTNSRIEVAVGVRLYDAQNYHPTYFSLANAVTVGNASR